MKTLIELKCERKELDFKIKSIPKSKIKYLIARYLCVIALEKDLKIYSWLWLLLPNWRYYLRLKYNDKHNRFGRYSSNYWKPDRIKLFRVNNYRYKLCLIKQIMKGLKNWYKNGDGWFYTIFVTLGSIVVALVLKVISYI